MFWAIRLVGEAPGETLIKLRLLVVVEAEIPIVQQIADDRIGAGRWVVNHRDYRRVGGVAELVAEGLQLRVVALAGRDIADRVVGYFPVKLGRIKSARFDSEVAAYVPADDQMSVAGERWPHRVARRESPGIEDDVNAGRALQQPVGGRPGGHQEMALAGEHGNQTVARSGLCPKREIEGRGG